MTAGMFDDRSCVICRAEFDGGDGGRRIRHCCSTCGHTLDDHTDRMSCRVCGHECGIDCRPMRMRGSDRWPVKFPWLQTQTQGVPDE